MTRIENCIPVITPGGAGLVLEVQVNEQGCYVLVLLDTKRNQWGYRGTVYKTADVRPLTN